MSHASATLPPWTWTPGLAGFSAAQRVRAWWRERKWCAGGDVARLASGLGDLPVVLCGAGFLAATRRCGDGGGVSKGGSTRGAAALQDRTRESGGEASEPVYRGSRAARGARTGAGTWARQRQARALGWTEIERFLYTAGESVPATRERAQLCVAYDTMARRSELVALNLGDLDFLAYETGRALIRRSKTDPAGDAQVAHLSRMTVRQLQRWLDTAEVREGAIFRQVVGHEAVTTGPDGKGMIGERLLVAAVSKRVAASIGLSDEDVRGVSGHSIRVGATQDLLPRNIDLGLIMQAGRWTRQKMPCSRRSGGMARAAEKRGRDLN